LVDAVSSLAGIPVHFDDWKLDVCLASVQKGIALPPGITVVAVSEAAVARAQKHPYRGTYFDFLEYKKQAESDGVPATPSIPHFYALAKQLDHIIREETLAARFDRHRRMRDLTIERTATYARLASDPAHASMTVSALEPSNVDAETIRFRMKERGFTLGGGYGQWKEKTFRIGHMGDIPLDSVQKMLDVLDEVAAG
ncbi:MAG TPA: aminotransferase class V-fold PLP-dependent enzyme, partial [Thermoanaerobaculia bacterium]